MRKFRRGIYAVVLLTVSSITCAVTLTNTTAFSVTPLTTQTTVQSNSESSEYYTITNNASSSISNLSIAPRWQSAGVGLTLTNDNCSNQTLPSGSSCTVDISVPGANQPSNFTIRPKVCGFNGLICSQAANTAAVNVVQHTLPIRVYQVILTADRSTEKLVGININNVNDRLQVTIADPNSDGPLAISHDGTRVYMTHNNGDGTFSLLVFDVTSNSLTQDATSYSLSYEDKNLGSPGQIAISPDGTTAYVTNSSYAGDGYPVYKIDLSSSTPASAVTGISDATPGGDVSEPRSIVISPDGQTVYLANSNSATNDIFSFSNMSSTTSISTTVKETDLSSIRELLISSDGSSLYAAGQNSDGGFPATIVKYDVADNFATEGTFLPEPEENGNVFAVALSPDNDNIYSIANTGGTYLLYSIDTANMTAPLGGVEFPYDLKFGINNIPYIAYSPDDSVVAITNYGDDGNLIALFNPSTPNDVTTVNPAGEGATMYSYSRGFFIN